MKKTYKGIFPLLISVFILIFWDIWRIRVLMTTKPSLTNIIFSSVLIILFIPLAYRILHMYLRSITIRDDRIVFAGLLRDKKIFFKDVANIKDQDGFLALTLKSKEIFSIRLKDINEAYRDDIRDTLFNLIKRK
ncbi:MAG: hypothetical protein ACRDDY_08435 [Clostridium sp.]|uniref:hypothetical protein n=1 Tax=Clostridium sp. TaxID=1506 RepID=UPI003EE43E68